MLILEVQIMRLMCAVDFFDVLYLHSSLCCIPVIPTFKQHLRTVSSIIFSHLDIVSLAFFCSFKISHRAVFILIIC